MVKSSCDIEEMVRRLSLQPHPEGGFYREVYRSGKIIPGTGRPFATSIYYLLPAGGRSRIHQIPFDEVWHFYVGLPLEIVELTDGPTPRRTLLGTDLPAGPLFQHVVPAGTWFGARPLAGSNTPQGTYSLVGCTVAPGFDFSDLRIGGRGELIRRFPQHEGVIAELSDP